MSLFEWKDIYSVKVKELDNQHKKLVNTLNQLFEAMRSGAARDIISGIVKDLADYVVFHFTFEENLMKKYNYPDLPAQLKEHTAFTGKVKEFQQKHQDGHLMLSMEVMNFLKDWLKNHIQGSDQKYSQFFNSKGVV